jgi:hypothetical protein
MEVLFVVVEGTCVFSRLFLLVFCSGSVIDGREGGVC